ncbi:MAG TPA: DUF4157 domain-containing protein [Nakamurella sp.]
MKALQAAREPTNPISEPAAADNVAAGPNGALQVTCAVPIPGLLHDLGTLVRRRSVPNDPLGGTELSPDVAGLLARRRGRGEPLPADVARSMGEAMGADLGAVRVHTGAEPARLTRSVQATAFTHGTDIYFGAGTYAPRTPSGQRLLAHELAHTVQDDGHREPGGGPVIGRAADPAEAAADRVANDVLRRMRQRDAQDRTDEPTARPDPTRPGHDTIRRLVGFEVEMSVPTLRPANLDLRRIGRDHPFPHREVDWLFAGGLPWNHRIGATAAGITLHADHNKLAGSGEDLYNAIEDCSPGVTVPDGYVEISNLEYKTPALDELAAGSNNRFLGLANAIDDHAVMLMQRRPWNRIVGIPGAPGYYTGVPLFELEEWLPYLHPDSGWNDGYIPNARRRLRNLQDDVEWDMYVQATVGVLPTGLGTLYQSQAATLPAGHGGDINAASQDAANAVVHAAAAIPLQPFVTTFDTAVGGLTPLSREALSGTVTMAVSYAIGNAYGMTNIDRSTRKNAVQLMSKLADAVDIARVTTDELYNLRNHGALPAFVAAAATWIHANYPQTALAHWQAAPYHAMVTRERLFGRGAPTLQAATAGLLTDMFTRSTTSDVAIGRNMDPDPAPPALAAQGVNSGGQRGIPMEMRWIPQRPRTAGQLWPVFQQVLAEVRAANLVHAPALAQATILGAL